MLHNQEDLEGMPLILPILNYCDMMEGPFSFVRQECRTVCDIFGTPEGFCDLTYESPVSVPVAWSCSDDTFSLSCTGSRLTCTVPILEGELKYFYPDYKNYYYLPQEDTAVHKKSGRICRPVCQKKSHGSHLVIPGKKGRFLPQPQPLFDPVLKACYQDNRPFSLILLIYLIIQTLPFSS